MLYVVTKDGNENKWNLGERFPDVSCRSVSHIQADGDELGNILVNITGIPKSPANVQEWFGDHAKFIVSFLMD